jgi:4-amino-4-deoxy-L-arabinose transferase-like glycosyltransferase
MAIKHKVFLLLLAIILFSLAMRSRAMFMPHKENDEIVYQTLADKVSKNLADYSLQGTRIAKLFPEEFYNKPLYFRPPAFVYMLAVFTAVFGKPSAVMLPVIFGVLSVLLMFILAKLMYGEKKALLAALIFSLCPVMLFASSRILIDMPLTFFVMATVLVLLVSVKKQKAGWFMLSGLIFGFAVLNKESAFFILPVCFYLVFREKIRAKIKIYFLLSFAVTALLVIFPWFYCLYKANGMIFLSRYNDLDGYFKKFPFMDIAVNRPWYFYFLQVIQLAPVYIFGYFGLIKRAGGRRDLTEALWILSYFIGFTICGIARCGYQTRYILPAIPALCLLSADVLFKKGRAIWVIAVFLLAFGLLTGILTSLVVKPVELFSPFDFFKYVRIAK